MSLQMLKWIALSKTSPSTDGCYDEAWSYWESMARRTLFILSDKYLHLGEKDFFVRNIDAKELTDSLWSTHSKIEVVESASR